MRYFFVAFSITLATSACVAASPISPCVGRSNSAECRLYESQLAATFEAHSRAQVAAATATSAAMSIRATVVESERLQAEALAAAGATATIEAARAQADLERANAQATLVAATIEAQRSAAEATSTAVANAILLENQRLAAEATATAVSDASRLRHEQAQNEINLARFTGFVDGALKIIFGLLILGGATYVFVRLANAAWQWLDERGRAQAQRVDVGDGRIVFYDRANNKIYDPRMALTPVTNLNADGVSGLPRDLLELLLAVKRIADTAEVYRRMAQYGIDVDNGESDWRPAQDTPARLPEQATSDVAGVLSPAPPLRQVLATWRPDPGRMLLAYGASGPIYGRLSDLLSTGIVGRQGQGKTTLLRFVYAQCILVGAKAIVWDLHDDVVDELPGAQAFTSVDTIDESARAMRKELDRRIRGGLRGDPPIMVMVDEFNAVAAAARESVETCSRIILEGRKYGVFCMLSAKGLPSALFGGSTVRDSLSSHIAFNTSVRLAAQLGFEIEDARLVRDLRPGFALFDGPVDAQVVTFPQTSAEDIKALLPASQTASAMSETWNEDDQDTEAGAVSDTAIDEEKRERVRRLIKSGTKVSDTIKQVWGVSSGSGYIRASEEFNKILGSLVGD